MASSISWNWINTLKNSLGVGIAFVIALPLAWERHRSDRCLSLGTFPIVALASGGREEIARVLSAETLLTFRLFKPLVAEHNQNSEGDA